MKLLRAQASDTFTDIHTCNHYPDAYEGETRDAYDISVHEGKDGKI